MLSLVGAACVMCLVNGSDWPRIAALSFIILTVILCTSRLQLSEHHLVMLLPIAALVVALALPNRLIGVLYILGVSYCHIAAVNGLANTGGVGVWSDGVFGLADGYNKSMPIVK